ncbi:hypothetical protein MT349_19050 [Rathayibacter caricis]|uniref:hypothetical protein n=1 Tax=Rathayibacter caricis TaxID=110936 RepID=UPI001FB413B0|nr:hypothetical protein [Rathayibacter caricis]MCJ1697886.1 hypothetical protein [Rathayibacter caricis]
MNVVDAATSVATWLGRMSFIDAATIAVTWVAAASTLRKKMREKRSMLPSGVVLWTIACTLQVDVVYDSVDTWLGGSNITNLIYRALVIIALGCLEVMVIRATRGRGTPWEALVAAVVVAMVALQSLLWVLNSWPITDTYLSAYGGEIGREMFWNVMPICIGAFSVHVILSVGAEWRAHSIRATRWGLALIGFAAALDLLWLVENLATSAYRVVGDPGFFLGPNGDVVGAWLVGTMIACTGLGVAVASAETLVDHLWMCLLLVRATPVWSRAIKSAPELTLTGSAGLASSIFTLEVEHVLYRRWKEMLDCERAGKFIPTSAERKLLDEIARTLGGTTERTPQREHAGLSGLLSVGRA